MKRIYFGLAALALLCCALLVTVGCGGVLPVGENSARPESTTTQRGATTKTVPDTSTKSQSSAASAMAEKPSTKIPTATKPTPVQTVPANRSVEHARISLIAVGDNLIHSSIYESSRKGKSYDFRPLYRFVKPWVQQADIAFVNQEAPLNKDAKPSGYPRFNSPQEVGLALADTGFDIVNQANNHGLDKDTNGVLQTAKFWDTVEGVQAIGINRSAQERGTIRVQTVKGLRFAWLSYSYGTNGIPMKDAYLMNLINRDAMAVDLEAARKVSDAIIVSMHWGEEYSQRADSEQKELAQFLADEGVLLIIGHHPHVIQPAQWVTGKNGNTTFVAYSLGNFISSQAEALRMLGGMLSCDIVYENGSFHIENPGVIPLVTHFVKGVTGYVVYPLKDYTPALAKQHFLTLNGKTVSVSSFQKTAEQILGEFYFTAPGVAYQ